MSYSQLYTIFPFHMFFNIFSFSQIRKLDDTEFRNPWARSYIRVTRSVITFIIFFHLSSLGGDNVFF